MRLAHAERAVAVRLCYEPFAMLTASSPRKAGTHSRLLGVASCCLLSLCLTPACQTSCAPGNQAVILWADGITNVTQRTYESTPYDGEWLHYPSNRRFEFPHRLGTTDYTIAAYVAFNNHPVVTDGIGTSDIALAAGDIMVIERKSEDTLVVRNDTCSEEYLYIRLQAAPHDDAGVAAH